MLMIKDDERTMMVLHSEVNMKKENDDFSPELKTESPF